MRFSSLGKLQCVCRPEDLSRPFDDRRDVCRECGHDVPLARRRTFDRELTQAEIHQVVSELRLMGRASRKFAIPSTVANLAQLATYLQGSGMKLPRRIEVAVDRLAASELD